MSILRTGEISKGVLAALEAAQHAEVVRLGDGTRQMPLEADGVAIAARDVG